MAINVAQFCLGNVADTCAIWNVLSSRTLYSTALASKCAFACTEYVRYECLSKRRRRVRPPDMELRQRLEQALASNKIVSCTLDVGDLQEVEVLRNKKRLGTGELSSIAFAKRTGLAFFTDDQKARKLAARALESGRVQTTPHLLGWLLYCSRLGDGDAETIVAEHKALGGTLEPHLRDAYSEAMRCRLLARSSPVPSGG